MNLGAYLNWFQKLSRPKGLRQDTPRYLRNLEILNREFSPYVVGGLSQLEEVLADVDWSKSPGWPYVNQGCSSKREAWDLFQDEIVERVEKMLRGEYVECIFIATPKDELLPEGKKPRIFLPAPFHHQLACGILFKKACDALTATVHKHSSAIGVNIFGGGLERLFRHLDELPFAYDADQSGCDTSWKDPEAERDFMKNGLPQSSHAAVDLCFNTAMCPQVIVGDRVLQLELNPSGWYLTTVMNTLMTHRTIASAYMDLSSIPVTIDDMRIHLRQINGGDDLGYSTDQPWFTITTLAGEVARYGMYLETDVLEPRKAFDITFFSHTLRIRKVEATGSYHYVACGRLAKILSAFSYLKLANGNVDWLRNSARVVGLMTNLWAYKTEYELLYPYLYHLIHHFFLLSGSHLSAEWSGVFRSVPTDMSMLALRNGHAYESDLLFFPPLALSSCSNVKRSFQSALKSDPIVNMTKTKSQKKRARAARQKRISGRRGLPPPPRPSRTGKKRVQVTRRPRIGLSECARDYLSVTLNPFSGKTACIPAGFNVPSEKFSYRARGSLFTGTAGYGALVINPFSCLWNDTNTFTNTAPGVAILTSLATWGGTAVPGYGDGGLAANTTNAAFASNTPSTSVNQRIVGLGVRVRNTTAMLYRGGQIIACEHPTHVNIVGQTANQLLSYETSGPGDVNGKWTTLVWHPVDDDDVNYLPGNAVATNAVAATVGPRCQCMAILIAAPTNNAQTYEYEVCVVAEAVGTACRGLTPSYNDASGYAMVANSFASPLNRRPFIGDTARSVVRALGSLAGTALREAAQSFMTSAVPSATPLITSI